MPRRGVATGACLTITASLRLARGRRCRSAAAVPLRFGHCPLVSCGESRPPLSLPRPRAPATPRPESAGRYRVSTLMASRTPRPASYRAAARLPAASLAFGRAVCVTALVLSAASASSESDSQFAGMGASRRFSCGDSKTSHPSRKASGRECSRDTASLPRAVRNTFHSTPASSRKCRMAELTASRVCLCVRAHERIAPVGRNVHGLVAANGERGTGDTNGREGEGSSNGGA